MRFNTRIRYGLRAIIEIALDESENGVLQKEISERQKISVKYLDNIISALKTAGLITNTKGKKSGYKLARKPDKIKIIDVHNAFEPGISVVDCMNRKYACDIASKCYVRSYWRGLNDTIINYLESRTIEDLIKEHKLKS